jgi:transcriptional regulator with XRE-family HTH domain
MENLFGEFIKTRRLSLELGLRDFCLRAKMDPSNYSKYERGVLPAPGDKDLKRIARGLSIPIGSSDWNKLVDLAAVQRSEFPTDLNVRYMHLLPTFYQKLRGHEGGEIESLQDLADLLRDEA